MLSITALFKKSKGGGLSSVTVDQDLLKELKDSIPRPSDVGEFGEFFDRLSKALKMDRRVKYTAGGKLVAESVCLLEPESRRVRDIFVEFFEPEKWESPEVMVNAWRCAVGRELKCLVFNGEEGRTETPASIFMNAKGALGNSKPANVIDLNKVRELQAA